MATKRKTRTGGATITAKNKKKAKVNDSDDEDKWLEGVESEDDVTTQLMAKLYNVDLVCTKSM